MMGMRLPAMQPTPDSQPTRAVDSDSPSGSRASFDRLVQEYAEVLWRVARRLCDSDATAQDVVQETYLEAWRGIGSIRDPGRARAWLLTILRRRASRARRWRLRLCAGQHASLDADDIASPDAGTLARMSDRERIDRALAAVPAAFRETLVLVFVAGASVDEAAAALGVARNTVLSRIHRGRAALRAALRADEEASR